MDLLIQIRIPRILRTFGTVKVVRDFNNNNTTFVRYLFIIISMTAYDKCQTFNTINKNMANIKNILIRVRNILFPLIDLEVIG